MMQMPQRGKVWKQFELIQILQTILCHENRLFSRCDPVIHKILWFNNSDANANGQIVPSLKNRFIIMTTGEYRMVCVAQCAFNDWIYASEMNKKTWYCCT